MRNQGKPRKGMLAGTCAILLLLAIMTAASAQSAPQTGTQPKAGQEEPPTATNQQPSVPDAPSATRPSPFGIPPGRPPAEAPAPDIREVPPGSAPDVGGSGRDELFRLVKNVNFVFVPVTVKDDNGHLVEGLLRRDFEVRDDGQDQKITFFTSDPFPLSAAVVLDLGMPDTVLEKVKETLPALVGAFGQFDEVGVYTYGNTVQRVQDFNANFDRLSASIHKIRRDATGRTGGVPVVGGPLGSGPTINGRPLDPGAPQIPVYRPESRVLNDAILEAAMDLSRRDPTRRKVLFVVSDGREYGSSANFNEVKKVLLTRQITVYGVAVGGAAIPGYGQLERIRIPGTGYGDILPKYASATGGQVFAEFSQSAIEQAYSRITSEARNQYTIGYTTRATPSSSYHAIEVVVKRPNLKVYARDGYYPLPPGR
jgi:VWFA-related protein